VTRLAEKDAHLKSQEESILELQRTVSALMDEIEYGYEMAQFDPMSPPSSPAFSPNLRSSNSRFSLRSEHVIYNDDEDPTDADATLSPTPLGSTLEQELQGQDKDQQQPQQQNSLNSLADELKSIGENAPHVEGLSSLRSRLASLGLNTDGNRAILKKRLQRYIQKKKKAEIKKAGGSTTQIAEHCD
jgi:hypothetical protein